MNRRDFDFLLYELLQVERLCQNPLYANFDRASFDSILDSAEVMAKDHFAPLEARMDREEPTFDGNHVQLFPEEAITAAGDRDRKFYLGKLHACWFFFTYELPRAVTTLKVVATLDETSVTMPEGAYAADWLAASLGGF